MVEAGQEIVVTSNSTLVKTKLYRGDVEGSLREWPVEPGPVHIATSARDTRLLVAFNGTGTYTVCTHDGRLPVAAATGLLVVPGPGAAAPPRSSGPTWGAVT